MPGIREHLVRGASARRGVAALVGDDGGASCAAALSRHQRPGRARGAHPPETPTRMSGRRCLRTTGP